MKARLIPVYFLSGKNEDFERQLAILKELLAEVADFLDPVSLGSALRNCWETPSSKSKNSKKSTCRCWW